MPEVKELAEKLRHEFYRDDLPNREVWRTVQGTPVDWEALAHAALEFCEERNKDLEEFYNAVVGHPEYSIIRKDIKVATAELAFLNIPPYEEPR